MGAGANDQPAGGTSTLEPSSLSSRRFAVALGLIVFAALVIRVGAAIWYDTYTTIEDDAVWYAGVAKALAHGDGFLEPFHSLIGQRVATAAHPPLYPVYLSAVELTGGSSTLLLRLWSTLPGTATVILLGLIGRDVAGRRTGLIAASLGAVSVELFAQDVRLWSEGLYGFTIALTVFAAYRHLRRPDLLHVALLAGAISLAVLTRAEAALLYVILLVPLVLRGRGEPVARRLGALVVAGVVAIVFLSPWLVYNNTGRFEHPVLLTTTAGLLIGTSNCKVAYYGTGIGGWGGRCADTRPPVRSDDETVIERQAREAGVTYISDHLGRVPVVVAARLGRTFGFYAPTKVISDDLLFEEAKVNRLAYLVLAQYWLYLGLGIAGGVLLSRRRVALLPLVAPVITVAVMTVLAFGSLRFRMGLDVVLPVLAAVAVDAFLGRRAQRSSSDASTPRGKLPARISRTSVSTAHPTIGPASSP
jgi:4-amino-4-deoxy-L-arabinose transferase-like glycosyltransferase